MEDEGEVTEGLSPETEKFFESGGKTEPTEKKAEPEQKAKPEAAKPEQKAKLPEQQKGAKPDAPKDPPDVELQRTKAAMSEERERRKEIAQQLARESEARKGLEEKFNKFLAAINTQEQAPPEFEKDPAANLDARERALRTRLEEFERREVAREQQGEQQVQLRRFQTWVAGQTQNFIKESPDYADAYQFVRNLRGKELEALGVPGEHIEPHLNQWEMQMAAAAAQLGKNPAAALYGQALALGYARKAEGAPAAAEQSKLEQLARGAEAAKGLGGGNGGPTELSLEKIMQMDEDEMAELVRGKGWAKVSKLFKQ